MSATVSTKRKLNVATIAKISILGALSFIVMMFQFPLPIAPAFYQIDFSEVIVLIGGFALGPWAAVLIEGMKILLNLLLNGSLTAGVGEAANFIIGCAFILPAIWIYEQKKTKRQAVIGLLIGIVSMSVFAALLNYFVLIPAFAYFANYSTEMIVGMGHAILPSVNDLFTLIVLCVIPFNLIKGILVSVIVFICYKKTAPLLKK